MKEQLLEKKKIVKNKKNEKVCIAGDQSDERSH
jgi:hypothetical protein